MCLSKLDSLVVALGKGCLVYWVGAVGKLTGKDNTEGGFEVGKGAIN